MANRAHYKAAHGNSVLRKPTTTTASFVTAGASQPTPGDFSGDVLSVARLLQGAIPFWRIELRHPIKLEAKQTNIQCTANANSAAGVLIEAAPRYVKGGLTDDTIGVIPTDKTTVQFDVVLLAGTVAVDTAGVLFDVVIHHDSV